MPLNPIYSHSSAYSIDKGTVFGDDTYEILIVVAISIATLIIGALSPLEYFCTILVAGISSIWFALGFLKRYHASLMEEEALRRINGLNPEFNDGDQLLDVAAGVRMDGNLEIGCGIGFLIFCFVLIF